MKENYILLAIMIAILSCCCNSNLAFATENREYTITYESDIPVEGWKELSKDVSYSCNKDCFLLKPRTYGYTFAGWEDEHGNIIPRNMFPKDTIKQNIRLKAVWISNRNKFYYDESLKRQAQKSIIWEDEEDSKFYYIYKFGRIENIPLKEIHKYGHHNKGETFERTLIKSITFKNENAQEVSQNIQKKAVNSSSITAIENWSETEKQDQHWNKTEKQDQHWDKTKKQDQNWNKTEKQDQHWEKTKKQDQHWDKTKKQDQNWNKTNENKKNYNITNENGQQWNFTVTETQETSKSDTHEHSDQSGWSQTDKHSHNYSDESGGSNTINNSTMHRDKNETSSVVQHSDGTYSREEKGLKGERDLTTRGWGVDIGADVNSVALGPAAVAGGSANIGFHMDGKKNANRLDISHNNNIIDIRGSNVNENITTQSNTNTTTWNHKDSVTDARAVTHSQATIDKIAKTITEKQGLSTARSNGGNRKTIRSQGGSTGNSFSQGGSTGNSSSVGGGNSSSSSQGGGTNKTEQSTDEYATANGEVSTITYSDGMEVSKTESYTLNIKHSGNYREVVAGTAYIYKIVGYNLKTGKFFTFDHYVLDDKVHTFLDYSANTDSFNDCESDYDASFAIPAEVFNHIANSVYKSKGLVCNPDSGSVEEYEGKSDTVIIPEYACKAGETEEDGSVVKVTSIDKLLVFTENTAIKRVILSDFITEIPDKAFLECTSLEYVWGGNIQKIGHHAFYNCKSLKSIAVGSIKEIGNEAFSGCTSLEKIIISPDTKSIGYKAFNEVKEVEATPCNAKLLESIVYSGAKRISIKTNKLDSNSLSGKYIEIGKNTEYFYFGENKDNKKPNKQFKNLTINSRYATNEIIFENIAFKNDACYSSNVWYDGKENHNLTDVDIWCNKRIFPLQLASQDVKFYNVNIESTGIAIQFYCDHGVKLGLYDTSKVKSQNECAIICTTFINPYRAKGEWSASLLTNQKVCFTGDKDAVNIPKLQKFFKKENKTTANIIFDVDLLLKLKLK